jgi:hypothetical protein
LSLSHLFSGRDQDFPNQRVGRRQQAGAGKFGISRGFGIQRRAKIGKALIAGTKL